MAKKDYTNLAQSLIKDVGGQDNIDSYFHCATRMRFQLKDISKAKSNTDKIKALDDVINVVVQNGQYQVVIGPNVGDVYDAIQHEIGDISGSEEEKPKSKWNRFFEVVSGLFTPIVPVLMASGMMGALITILNLCNVLPKNSPEYFLLNVVYQAGFYFLPFYIADSSAKVLHANRYLAMLLAGVMLYPKLWTFKGALTFLHMPVQHIEYGQAVLPIILGVWALAYVERFFEKIMPDIIKAFMAPLLTMIIMMPIMLIVIGPLGTNVGNVLATGVKWMGNNWGFLAVGIIAFFTPLMIATGTHSFAFPVVVATLTSLGYDQVMMPSMLAENLAMAGAAFGIAVLAKDKKKKSGALAASLSAILGISEPSMYGFVIPSGYGFLGAMLGALVGGLFGGLFKFRMYMIASSSVIGIPAMFGKDAGIGNVVVGILEIIISFVAAFGFTFLLRKSNFNIDSIMHKKQQKKERAERKELAEKKQKQSPFNKPTTVVSPVKGTALPLSEVKDEVFSTGSMGKGIAIKPECDLVKSPVNGEVIMAYPTGHAIGLRSTDGVEILIHIGMDTVNLNGKGFNLKVKQGDKVKIGDPLVKFDSKVIKEAGYSDIIPIVITNTNKYHDVKALVNGNVDYGQEILELD